MQINHERKVVNASCTCLGKASGKCNHIYSLIYNINSDTSASKTSLEQKWGKPSDSTS